MIDYGWFDWGMLRGIMYENMILWRGYMVYEMKSVDIDYGECGCWFVMEYGFWFMIKCWMMMVYDIESIDESLFFVYKKVKKLYNIIMININF